jgi:hypothetical protein
LAVARIEYPGGFAARRLHARMDRRSDDRELTGNQEPEMTIPFALPFGRRRLVFSVDLLPAPAAKPAAPARSRRIPDPPGALDATDAELARINGRAAAAADRIRWEAQSVYHGLRAY